MILRGCFLVLLILLLGQGRMLAGPGAKDVPNYRVRVRVTNVNGKSPTAGQQFGLSLEGNPKGATFAGPAWSAWKP